VTDGLPREKDVVRRLFFSSFLPKYCRNLEGMDAKIIDIEAVAVQVGWYFHWLNLLGMKYGQ